MGAIKGADYLNRLNELNNEIWFNGEKVEGNVSEHPAFKGLLQTKASLYDLQHDPKIKEEMTFTSPLSGEPVGLSYLQPKTKEDLKKRRKMIEHWARYTNGIMGRSPDYLNTVLMSLASSKSLLEGKENCFPQNIQAFFEFARENDLSLTHTFVAPQVNRSQYYIEKTKEPIAAKIVGKNEEGLIIKGARLLATQGGLTDEVLVVGSSKNLFNEDEIYAFAIPSNTKGLKFICRDTFVGSDSTFDHPLSSRYEEIDSTVVFDNVLVPWDRVFYYSNEEVESNFGNRSSFQQFAKHQAIIRQIVKTEFILGVAELVTKTINVGEYPHIQEKIAEIIVGLETMKALLDKSENNATLNDFGYMCPDIFPLKVAGSIYPKLYPRFMEIIQIIGASGMINLLPENAFHSAIRSDIDHYFQATNKDAEERIKIFRLAWDLTMSSFGTRQTQYERYFFGDPISLSNDLYKTYPKQQYVENINQFLQLEN